MTGVRLEARIHIVTAAQSYGQNLVKCCERAGVAASELVLQPLASAEAALFPEEGELAAPGLAEPVEVRRDAWGVPYIRAGSLDDLWFAHGMVTAGERLFQLDLLLEPLFTDLKLLLLQTRPQIVGLCSAISKWNHEAQATRVFRELCRETLEQRLAGSCVQFRVIAGKSGARVQAEDVYSGRQSVGCEARADVLVCEILLCDAQVRPFLESSRKRRVQLWHVPWVWFG